jgi:hypothetical protein
MSEHEEGNYVRTWGGKLCQKMRREVNSLSEWTEAVFKDFDVAQTAYHFLYKYGSFYR